MMRESILISCVALLSGAAFGQSNDIKLTLGARPAFEAADVRVSPHTQSNFGEYMKGPLVHAGQYQIRTATMVDLIATAYSLDQEKVFGGPTWLELDRYNVTGKIPAGSTKES